MHIIAIVMKVRLARFFRFRTCHAQAGNNFTICQELYFKRMLCTLTPEEAESLYQQLDEEYTKVHGKKPVRICMPRVEEFVEVNNLEMLMGRDRPDEEPELAEKPVEILQSTKYGVTFASKEGFEFFVEAIQKYIDKKVQEEIAKAKEIIA